ncbi:GNAT family N-acetyltransferase [Saliphagus infecundisoli]|uniref:GNAT family N-acetyltransferase n=1 Tax=Saliphagus infecundisoli TaxID=1849069 RepID=A0ABD5QF01_9EURY|nr:GNAT family N-acetyltransferase [Saliphagus infecundisoli]
MEYEILGWPPDGPTLRLDHERFSYAGKFVMSNTGKAVAREDGEVVAAVAFNEDRTDDRTLWLRYVTVRNDRRGEGIGPELLSRVREAARERGYDRLRIAVNNPYAFEALYRTGFAYTGETTGIAELVLEYPPDAVGADPEERYREGLAEFEGRELTDGEERFLAEKGERGPPERIE